MKIAVAVLSIIAGGIVTIVVFVVGKFWEPIAEHVGYPFGVRKRVKDLEDEVKKVREIQVDLQQQLDLYPYPSSDRRAGWFRRVQDLRAKAQEIKAKSAGCGRLNYLRKCNLVRQAVKELKKATNLVETGNHLLNEAEGWRRPGRDVQPRQWHPQAQEDNALAPSWRIQSHSDIPEQSCAQNQLWGMSSYKQKVIDFIKDDSSNQSGLLGIWGMPGVGKTSLLQSVYDSALQLNSVPGPSSSAEHDAPLFDHILLIRSSDGPENTAVGEMQRAIIADCMILSVAHDETSQGNIIRNHLKDKSFLLLIDDAWGCHDDLGRVGIPMPLGTVQRRLNPGDVVVVQKYQRKVVFTTTSEDVCGDMSCAKNIIRLKCLSKDDAWKLFIDKVENNEVINDKDLATQVVDECGGLPMALCTMGRAMSTKRDPNEWKCAIDLLKDSKLLQVKMSNGLINSVKRSYDHMRPDLKKCFLISLLWPRGENIPKDKLVEWWTGLGLLDVRNAINGGCMIINDLLRASMLEKGDTNLYSSENSHVKVHEVIREMAIRIGKDDRLLPLSFCRSALPEEEWRTVQKAWISAVDSLEWTSSVSFPQLTMLVSRRHDLSFEALTCFQSITFLDMKGTKLDKFPTAVCSLQTLQYLNLSATKIDALPNDLQKLSNLKYLYIRDIGTLQTVPNELISQLTKLQVLDLFCSGSISTSNGQYFSSLIEGLFPCNIIALGITVRTPQDIMKLLRLEKKAVHTQALCMHHFEGEKNHNLELFSHMEKLRELTITNSRDIERLIVQGRSYDKHGLVHNLEFLELSNLHRLREVTWKDAGINIRVIVIHNCTEVKHVTWVQCLQRLQELTISYCPELEKVIDNLGNQQVKSFSKLKKLYLEELPKLSTISEQSRTFEELSYVFVARCENLKVIRVELRRNHNKIKIDCTEGWWTSLEENQRIMKQHFVPTFCF